MRGLETAYRLFGLLPDTLAAPGPAARSLRRAGGGLLRSRLGDALRRGRGGPRASSGWCWRTRWCTRSRASTSRSTPSSRPPRTTTGSRRRSRSSRAGDAGLDRGARAGPGRDARRRSSGRCTATRCAQQQSAMPVFARAPLVVREALIFPYLDGAEFMHWWETAGAEGHAAVRPPHAGVDRADPPSRALRPRRPAGAARVPRRTAACCYEDVLGENEIRVLLARAGRLGRGADRGADRLGRRPLPGVRHRRLARRSSGTWCGTTSARPTASSERPGPRSSGRRGRVSRGVRAADGHRSAGGAIRAGAGGMGAVGELPEAVVQGK